MLQQRKNGKYLLPTLSDLGSADTRAESHRYSSNYEDFKRVDNLKQRKSMVDDVSYLCCECGDRDEHDDGHQFHRDSLVDDEVAPPSSLGSARTTPRGAAHTRGWRRARRSRRWPRSPACRWAYSIGGRPVACTCTRSRRW